LTYVKYGWDVTEPITYLIGLGVEIFGIYYFLRRGRFLNMRALFESKTKAKKRKLLLLKSTNPE